MLNQLVDICKQENCWKYYIKNQVLHVQTGCLMHKIIYADNNFKIITDVIGKTICKTPLEVYEFLKKHQNKNIIEEAYKALCDLQYRRRLYFEGEKEVDILLVNAEKRHIKTNIALHQLTND